MPEQVLISARVAAAPCDQGSPRAASLLISFMYPVVLRVLLFIAALHCYHLTATEFARLRDGSSYIAMAKAMSGDPAEYQSEAYHQRVFPGFPAIIAVIHLMGVPWHMAALGFNWLATGVISVLVGLCFRDARLAWAMDIVTPSYLMYSTTAMNEPALLLFIMLGMFLLQRQWTFAAGLSLGFAGVIRPVACFAVLGCITQLGVQRQWRQSVRLACTAAVVVGATMLTMHFTVGEAFRNLHAYSHNTPHFAGRFLDWPFQSLVMTTLFGHIPLWKIAYVWTCVTIDLVACHCLGRQWRTAVKRKRDCGWLPLATIWAVSNTAFVASVGSAVGFQEFHRFMLHALPAVILAFQPYFPRKSRVCVILTVPAAALALSGLYH